MDAFILTYGPGGEWTRLFGKADGYVRTELYRDVSKPSRFVTTDIWESKQARDAFRERFADEYETLDRKCEVLTSRERFLGDFEIMDSEATALPSAADRSR